MMTQFDCDGFDAFLICREAGIVDQGDADARFCPHRVDVVCCLKADAQAIHAKGPAGRVSGCVVSCNPNSVGEAGAVR